MTSPLLTALLGAIGGFITPRIWDYLSQLNNSKEKVELKKLQLQAAEKEYRSTVFKEYEEKFEHVLSELSEAKDELSKANEKIAKMMAYWDSMTRMAILHLEEDKPEVAKLFKEFQQQIKA